MKLLNRLPCSPEGRKYWVGEGYRSTCLAALLIGLFVCGQQPLLAQEEDPTNEELLEARRQADFLKRDVFGAHEVSPQLRRIEPPPDEESPAYLNQAVSSSSRMLLDTQMLTMLVNNYSSRQIDRRTFARGVKKCVHSPQDNTARIRANRLLRWVDWKSGAVSAKPSKTPDDVAEACRLLEREAAQFHERICRLSVTGVRTIRVSDMDQASFSKGAYHLSQLARKVSKQARRL